MKVPRSVKKQIRSDVKGRVAKMNTIASNPIEKLQNKVIGVKATRALIKDAKNKQVEMKTGGMVNSNAKAAASKVARGKVGGISKAPKKAKPC
jgi:hypothetical protein